MDTGIPDELYEQILRKVESVDGWLLDREIRFLATAAAYPTCSGSIVELGSYQGKSTIVIAHAADLDDGGSFVTVDPFPSDLRARFDTNLKRAGLVDRVTVHQMTSDRFVDWWDRPIRLLFHDGSNEIDIVRRDIARLRHLFVEGAIIAFHDVLNTSGYRAVCFLEDVLSSDNFGPIGFCGSIGWGQYFSSARTGKRFRCQRMRLRRRLSRLLPFLGRPLNYTGRLRYKLIRASIPHRKVNADVWLRDAA